MGYWIKININSVIEIFFKIQEELNQMEKLTLIEGQWKLQMELISEVNVDECVESQWKEEGKLIQD